MRLQPLLCLLLLLACGHGRDSAAPPLPIPAAASTGIEEYSAPYWNVRIGAVRAELKKVRRALDAQDREAAKSAWFASYRQVFEPQVEAEARGRMDEHDLARIEYAFGRLGAALSGTDDEASLAALADVESRLQALADRLAVRPQSGGSSEQAPSAASSPRASTSEQADAHQTGLPDQDDAASPPAAAPPARPPTRPSTTEVPMLPSKQGGK
jgi:hypothetical protein